MPCRRSRRRSTTITCGAGARLDTLEGRYTINSAADRTILLKFGQVDTSTRGATRLWTTTGCQSLCCVTTIASWTGRFSAMEGRHPIVHATNRTIPLELFQVDASTWGAAGVWSASSLVAPVTLVASSTVAPIEVWHPIHFAIGKTIG